MADDNMKPKGKNRHVHELSELELYYLQCVSDVFADVSTNLLLCIQSVWLCLCITPPSSCCKVIVLV